MFGLSPLPSRLAEGFAQLRGSQPHLIDAGVDAVQAGRPTGAHCGGSLFPAGNQEARANCWPFPQFNGQPDYSSSGAFACRRSRRLFGVYNNDLPTFSNSYARELRLIESDMAMR